MIFPYFTRMELVWDKTHCIQQLGNITIYAAPKEHPPFSYKAIVEEQDTHLLLQQQTLLRDPGKPAWYLANKLDTDENYRLGDVVIRGQAPKRLLAIVHDVEQTPTCTIESVELAYQHLMICVKQQGFSSLALPLLGTVHGKIPIEESINLLSHATQQNPPACLLKIWLILPDHQDCSCLQQLTDYE